MTLPYECAELVFIIISSSDGAAGLQPFSPGTKKRFVRLATLSSKRGPYVSCRLSLLTRYRIESCGMKSEMPPPLLCLTVVLPPPTKAIVLIAIEKAPNCWLLHILRLHRPCPLLLSRSIHPSSQAGRHSSSAVIPPAALLLVRKARPLHPLAKGFTCGASDSC